MCFNLYFNAICAVIDGYISAPFEREPVMQLMRQALETVPVKMLKVFGQ